MDGSQMQLVHIEHTEQKNAPTLHQSVSLLTQTYNMSRTDLFTLQTCRINIKVNL